MILVSPRMRWFVTVVYIGTVVHSAGINVRMNIAFEVVNLSAVHL